MALLDCEGDEHDGREPEEDLEPSLGSIEGSDQKLWSAGNASDLEVDIHDQPHDPETNMEGGIWDGS